MAENESPQKVVEPQYPDLELQREGLKKFFMSKRTKPQDVEDLTQQVFEQVLAALRGGEIILDLRSYCITTAHHIFISLGQRKSRSPVTFDSEKAEAEPIKPGAVWRNEPYQRLSAIARVGELLQKIVSRYGKKCRDVFVLDRGEGFTDEEISERMGLSVHTVRKHKTNAHNVCEAAKDEDE